MAQIKDKVSVQLYGDAAFQDQIIDVLKSGGVAVAVGQTKPYTTKKGDEGTYRSLTLTYADDTQNN